MPVRESLGIIDSVRNALQHGPDGNKPAITTYGNKIFYKAPLLEAAFEERAERVAIPPEELEEAKDIADYINTELTETCAAQLEMTLDDETWLHKENQRIIDALHFFGAMCSRAANVNLLPEWYDEKEVCSLFAADYLVSSAILGWEDWRKRRADPGIYFSPTEIAELRMRFPRSELTDSQFLGGLILVPTHKDRAHDLLSLMQGRNEGPTYRSPSKAYALYKANGFRLDGIQA